MVIEPGYTSGLLWSTIHAHSFVQLIPLNTSPFFSKRLRNLFSFLSLFSFSNASFFSVKVEICFQRIYSKTIEPKTCQNNGYTYDNYTKGEAMKPAAMQKILQYCCAAHFGGQKGYQPLRLSLLQKS